VQIAESESKPDWVRAEWEIVGMSAAISIATAVNHTHNDFD